MTIRLTSRFERIVEKKMRENPRWSSHPDCNLPKVLHEVIVSDHTFSGDIEPLSPNFTPYRVGISVSEEIWDRLRVGMEVEVQWVVPDV